MISHEWRSVAEALVWRTGAESGLLARDLRHRRLVVIAPGAYLRSDALRDVASRAFGMLSRVTIARVLAVARKLRPGSALTCDSAMLVRGVGVVSPHPDVHVTSAAARQLRGASLPAVVLDGRRIAPGVAVMSHAMHGPGRRIEHIAGIPVADVDSALLDMCRCAEPQHAVVAVSGAWHRTTDFDRSRPEQGRRRAEALRQRLLMRIAEARGRRGYRRAEMVVRAADPGIESVPEGRMLAFLHAHRAREFQTQFRIDVRGRSYWPDFAFPSLGVLIEVDGYAKLGETSWQMRQGVAHLLDRSGEIQSTGRRVIHVRPVELDQPRELRARLGRVAPEIFQDSRPRPSRLWVP